MFLKSLPACSGESTLINSVIYPKSTGVCGFAVAEISCSTTSKNIAHQWWMCRNSRYGSTLQLVFFSPAAKNLIRLAFKLVLSDVGKKLVGWIFLCLSLHRNFSSITQENQEKRVQELWYECYIVIWILCAVLTPQRSTSASLFDQEQHCFSLKIKNIAFNLNLFFVWIFYLMAGAEADRWHPWQEPGDGERSYTHSEWKSTDDRRWRQTVHKIQPRHNIGSHWYALMATYFPLENNILEAFLPMNYQYLPWSFSLQFKIRGDYSSSLMSRPELDPKNKNKKQKTNKEEMVPYCFIVLASALENTEDLEVFLTRSASATQGEATDYSRRRNWWKIEEGLCLNRPFDSFILPSFIAQYWIKLWLWPQFKRRVQSTSVEGHGIIASARSAHQQALERSEARDAARRAAELCEEERVTKLKKLRGEKWLPSLAREMQVNLLQSLTFSLVPQCNYPWAHESNEEHIVLGDFYLNHCISWLQAKTMRRGTMVSDNKRKVSHRWTGIVLWWCRFPKSSSWRQWNGERDDAICSSLFCFLLEINVLIGRLYLVNEYKSLV